MLTIERAPAQWLNAATPDLEQRIVRRALCDVGITEMPPGSNRSPRIDEYVAAVGSPPGSSWCAAALAAWWRDSGAMTPDHDGGSCDEWVRWAKTNARWCADASVGRAVVYGHNDDAVHIGVIVRTEPLMLSMEGNTTLSGGFDSAGVAITLKEVDERRVLGFIAPVERGTA